MAFAELPFIDSFAFYDNTPIAARWQTINGSFIATRGMGSGRSAAANSGEISAASDCFISKQLVGSYTTLVVGVALMIRYWGTNLIQINFDYSPAAGVPQIRLYSNNDGSLQVDLVRNGGAAVSSSKFFMNGSPLALNVWSYFEIKAVISGGNTITVDVYLNGTQHALSAFSNTFTAFTSNNLSTVGIRSPGTNGTNDGRICDVYINSSGTFYGDSVVLAYAPNGAGNYTQWTPSSAPNYSCVNSTPESSAKNNASANVGDKDTYTFTQINASATIKALQSTIWVEKDNTGVASLSPLYRSGVTDSLSPNTYSPAFNNYQQFIEGSEVSPFTAVAWTATEFNSLQAGVQRTA